VGTGEGGIREGGRVGAVDGTVQQLAVHTVGGVVTPAQALLEVLPLESRLEIEAMVPNHDVGFVRAGQEAAVKVDTFSFTKYGLLHGAVLDSRRMRSINASPRPTPATSTRRTPTAPASRRAMSWSAPRMSRSTAPR
jgi:hemolysin D